MSQRNTDPWEEWADALAQHNSLVIDDFLPVPVFTAMRNYFMQRSEGGDFRPAGIGTSGDYRLQRSIRGDEIYWLDRERDEHAGAFFALIDEVIAQLNRLCFLSISGSEFHLAHYPPGAFYERHLDQFREGSNRMISVVCYLNASWKPGDGGALRLYDDEGNYTDVSPLPGRLVIFRSDAVYHEVLPTTVSRYSVTGWLLHKPAGLSLFL